MASFDSKTISHIHHELHSHLPSEPAFRTKALESLLTEKKLIDPAAVDAWIEMYRDEIGPKRGAAVVARAWRDPAFKARLLTDGTAAIDEFGFAGHATGHLQAVENTADVHNLVVCTLCSCYPWEMLGLPPVWYKAAPYRSRAVKDPRGVLADFGVSLPKETEIRVWDSTAETRFLVLPMRPEGTEGWSEQQLAELVTRDSMIGTGFPKTPGTPS
jgi:nitrile hydratase